MPRYIVGFRETIVSEIAVDAENEQAARDIVDRGEWEGTPLLLNVEERGVIDAIEEPKKPCAHCKTLIPARLLSGIDTCPPCSEKWAKKR